MIGSIGARHTGSLCTSLFVALSALMTPGLRAQGPQSPLEREIVFVRGLAKEMRFIELAKGEADRLASEYRGAADQDKIAQLAVEISYYGARSRNDRAQQRSLFKEAVEKSQELIQRSSDASVQLEARSTLANASQDFGQFLIEELDIAREESPERVKEIGEEATKVFRSGIDACDKVMEALREHRKDPQKGIEFYLMWMRKAVLSREEARADKENRNVLLQRAIDELTELVLDVGEETAIGLRGLFEIAQCREVAGNVAEAIDSYRSTIDQIATSLEGAGELGLSGEMAGFLFDMMQEVYVHAGELLTSEGSPDTAALFTKFREHITTFGEKGDIFDVVSPTHGHMMLLAEARFDAESGDPAKVQAALAMTQRINDKHPADFVGVKAKAVLRDILAAQQTLVSGELLFEVAKGEMQNQNYEEAIKGARRAIAAMSADELKKFGLEAYDLLGSAYARSDRALEAMLAYEEGLRRFGELDKTRAEDPADSLDRVMSAMKRQTKNDPFFDSLYTTAANVIQKYSVSGGAKIFWKEGNNAMQEKKYAEAAAAFAKIDEAFVYYEQARVRIARAQSSAGDFAAARKTIADYRAWAQSHEANNSTKQSVRSQAMVEAAFIEVQQGFSESRGDDELKLKQDLTKYPAAIEVAKSFLTNHGKDGDAFVPVVLAYIGRLYADVGQMERAEEAYAQLKQKDPARSSRLATEIFKEYQTQEKALAKELDDAIAKNLGDKVIETATSTLDAKRSKLAALGLDYIASSPEPQLGVLVSTMQAFARLLDWKRVDEIAKKTLEQFGNNADPKVKVVVDQLVRPMVGEALLQQRRFQEAYDMLIAAEKANPTHWEIKRQIARCLGGWFEMDKTGRGQKVPGLARFAEAYSKHFTEYRTWAERPEVKKYSLEWYQFYWECYWFAKQASDKDGKFKDIAEKFYRIAKSTDDFATLRNYGVDGKRIETYFKLNR